MVGMKSEQPESLLAHYATQDDLQELRVDVQALRGDIQLLFAELRSLRAEILLQFQLMRSEMDTKLHEQARNFERAMHAQTWKMVGLVLTVNVATVTAVYYIAN